MTDTNIHLLDLYMLSYEGLKVVFQVCDTTPDSVFLIELATKRYKDGVTLTKKYKATKKPLIITHNNIFTKSTYEVPATREDKKLPIKITMATPIFWEAYKHTPYPRTGTFLAVPFPDHRNTYWKNRKKEEKYYDS